VYRASSCPDPSVSGLWTSIHWAPAESARGDLRVGLPHGRMHSICGAPPAARASFSCARIRRGLYSFSCLIASMPLAFLSRERLIQAEANHSPFPGLHPDPVLKMPIKDNKADHVG